MRAVVASAESFVRAQGYTDAPADEVALVLQWPEEETMGRTTILDERRGELLPRAVGVFAPEGGRPLAVVFEYTSRRGGARLGRALLDVDPPRFAHPDALVDHAIPVCPR